MPQVVNDAGNNGRPHFKGQRFRAAALLPRIHPRLLPTRRLPAILLPAIRIGPPCAAGGLPSSPAPSASSTETASAPETAIGGADPDRPHMAHGQQTPTDEFQPAQLTGVPSGMQQMIAVSDASDREAHPFMYLWADPADATKMQEQMEIAAAAAIAATAPPVKITPKAHRGDRRRARRRASCRTSCPKAGVYQCAFQGLRADF